jgi:AcrR family transcriptional regulator
MKPEIVKTSLDGFLKKGIRKMTIQKLVEPLGISSKTVYKYFSDKEDVLRECLAVHYSGLLIQALSVIESCPNAALALEQVWKQAIQTDFGVNRVFYYDLNHYYPELQDEILKKHGRKIEKTFLKLIRDGMTRGYFRKELDPQIVFEAMTVMYRSLTRTDDFRKFRNTPASLANQTIQVYLRGICTEKGLKELSSHEK